MTDQQQTPAEGEGAPQVAATPGDLAALLGYAQQVQAEQAAEGTPKVGGPDAQQTAEPKAPEATGKGGLEDLLADLPDDKRQAILGVVREARSDAAKYRQRAQADSGAKTELQQTQDLVQRMQSRMVRAEAKAQLAAVLPEPDGLLDALDLSKYVTDDGDVDSAKLADLAQTVAAFAAPQQRAPRPDPTQASGGQTPASVSPADEFASFIKAQLR